MAKWEVGRAGELIRDGKRAMVMRRASWSDMSGEECQKLRESIVAWLNMVEEAAKAAGEMLIFGTGVIEVKHVPQEVIAATGELRKPDGSKLESDCEHSHVRIERDGMLCLSCKKFIPMEPR